MKENENHVYKMKKFTVYLLLPNRGLWPGRYPYPEGAHPLGTTQRWRFGPKLTAPIRQCHRRHTPTL